jgi:uncharacterized protein YbjQ (UPF0145 family)
MKDLKDIKQELNYFFIKGMQASYDLKSKNDIDDLFETAYQDYENRMRQAREEVLREMEFDSDSIGV